MKRDRLQPSYRSRMARVVAAIAADPMAQYSLDELAALAHFSPFHFHRLYRSLMGETVTETMRRLRLAQAAVLLGERRRSVTEIGLAVGYDSPQAFTRAFRFYAGVAPREFQKKLQRMAAPHASAQSEAASAGEQGMSPPAVQLIEQPAMHVLALRHLGPAGTIAHTFRHLRQLLAQHQIEHWLGISSGDPEVEGSFSYFAAAVLQDDLRELLSADAGLSTFEIPAGCYAQHTLIGPYTQINATISALYVMWLPDSGYEPDDRPLLEFYRNSPLTTAAHALHTDLLIPVRPLSV